MFEMVKDTPEEVLVSLTRKYSWDLETQVILEDPSPPGIGFALLKVGSASFRVFFSQVNYRKCFFIKG